MSMWNLLKKRVEKGTPGAKGLLGPRSGLKTSAIAADLGPPPGGGKYTPEALAKAMRQLVSSTATAELTATVKGVDDAGKGVTVATLSFGTCKALDAIDEWERENASTAGALTAELTAPPPAPKAPPRKPPAGRGKGGADPALTDGAPIADPAPANGEPAPVA